MYISKRYKIQEQEQKLTLEIIRGMGFDQALEEAYNKALYLVANSPTSTLSTEWLAWSHNLLNDSRKVDSEDVAKDLRMLATFYRKLAHRVYWWQKQYDMIADLPEFIRSVE